MARLKPISDTPKDKRLLSVVPSGYKIYDNSSKIAWRSLKFSEITELSSKNRRETENCMSVYKSVIELTNAPYEYISIFDFIYTQIYVDLETVAGSVQSYTVECGECAESSTYELDISTLEFYEMGTTGYPLFLQVKDRRHMIDVFRIGDLSVRSELIANGIDKIIATFACMFREVMNIEDAVNIVSNLDHESSIALMAIDKEYNHGLKPVSKKCKHCGAAMSIAINAEVVDFLPFRGLDSFIGNKIHTKQQNQ